MRLSLASALSPSDLNNVAAGLPLEDSRSLQPDNCVSISYTLSEGPHPVPSGGRTVVVSATSGSSWFGFPTLFITMSVATIRNNLTEEIVVDEHSDRGRSSICRSVEGHEKLVPPPPMDFREQILRKKKEIASVLVQICDHVVPFVGMKVLAVRYAHLDCEPSRLAASEILCFDAQDFSTNALYWTT